MPIGLQIIWLFVLAVPIASIAWTVTQEEVFREPRAYFLQQSRHAPSAARRKFFYLFICEYCLSHWVALFFVAFTGYRLLLPDWRGYVIAFFALVWVANQYMSVYRRLRLDIKRESVEIDATEKAAETSSGTGAADDAP
jgi:type VI protein secretion system component VasK